MHIMLFGGAFDPPHTGHLKIAREIIEQTITDQIWFVPCAQHPFGKTMSPATDRVAMVRSAGSLTVNTYEIDTPSISYTIDTIEHFASTQPNDTFSWLIGSDQLPSFTRWHRWQDLVKNFTIYVYPRQDFPFYELQTGMVALEQLPLVTISSTMIRERVRQHQDIAPLVAANVATYITTHHLYE